MLSKRGTSSEKSTVLVSILEAKAGSSFSDQKSTDGINFCSSTLTSHLTSGFCLSIKSLVLKSSTKNPDLNLDNPSASWICKVFVLTSNKDNVVVNSRFSILSSRDPISLIVYLLLSTKVIVTSLGL